MLLLAAASPAPAAPAPERVGTYDSRVVAYACFWDPPHQAALKARQAEGQAAKERGDEARLSALERELAADQRRFHLQVFSNAPIPEHLARLQPRVDAVCRDAGVSRLVSRWDRKALAAVPLEQQVDVTAELIRGIPLTPKQRKVTEELARKDPLPLWLAKVLTAFGGI